ncbi:MAG: hypothetical protein JSU06_11945 [Actinobacteria bacterium]|nr:hypothetical protein [Actinomycetota bacterium]
MGAVLLILLVLALKIPILGLIWFVHWAAKEPEAEAPPEETVRAVPPEPEPGDPRRGPRRRGPHGGEAWPQPSPRRDQHPATRRESVPAPPARST